MNNIKNFIKKNSTIILSTIASSGVVITTVLAVKATPKAIKQMEEAEKNKGYPLTCLEKIKICTKPYFFTMLSGVSTMGCIISMAYLEHKKNVSLISAYSLLANSYNEYKNNTKEIAKDNDMLATKNIIEAKYNNEGANLLDNEELFFDYTTLRFFKSTFESVTKAGKKALDALNTKGYLAVNEWYDLLGIPGTDWGYQLGWANFESNDPYNCKKLDFTYEKIELKNNMSCWVILPSIPATFDYII